MSSGISNEPLKIPRLKAACVHPIISKVEKGNLFFGHLFPTQYIFTDWVICKELEDKIISRMTVSRKTGGSTLEEGQIPAGYTYLGQLITHDIVEPSGENKKRNNFSPYLDLGALYPDINTTINSSRVGADLEVVNDQGMFELGYADGSSCNEQNDLLRIDGKEARIPEPRNDENIIVSQLHLLFQKVHNQAVSLLSSKEPRRSQGYYYHRARIFVTLLFQKVVLDDYLLQILDPKIYKGIILENKTYIAHKYKHADSRTGKIRSVPTEFSHAAFRFGHAMVRESYELNDVSKDVPTGDLLRKGKGNRINKNFVIEWKNFFSNKNGLMPSNRAAKIGLRIARNLKEKSVDTITIDCVESKVTSLNDKVVKEKNEIKFLESFKHIISSDLRASAKVPTATEIIGNLAEVIESSDLGKNDQLNKLIRIDSNSWPNTYKEMLLENTSELGPIVEFRDPPLEIDSAPIWLYFLNEAEKIPLTGEGVSKSDQTLGPLCSLIIAEVIKLTIADAPSSCFQSWGEIKNELGDLADTYAEFTCSGNGVKMADLINFVQQ